MRTRDSRQRMANGAALCSHLPEIRGAKIVRVHGDHWRTFRAAVTFQGPNAEVIFKRLRDTFGQFFRSRHHDAQTAKRFRRNPPRIGIQKRGRGKQHGDGVFADQRSDGLRIQRTNVKHHANPRQRRQAQCARESKGVKEGKYPEDAVAFMEMKHLLQLFDVRRQIEMRENHAFRLSRGTAGKNNGCGVVERGGARNSKK